MEKNNQSSKESIISVVETPEKFVVFLDIMGFKDRVMRTKHEKLKEELKQLSNRIVEVLESKNEGITCIQFSDSIILFTVNNSNSQLESLVSVSCLIMQRAIELGFAMKGAMAKGEITCDKAKNVYFGQAQIDAYLLEENVWYYGIVVHHSAQSDVEKINENYISTLELPMKTGSIKHCELSWYAYDREKTTDIKKRISNIRYTVSDAPRRYIDNTEAVIKAFEERMNESRCVGV